MIGKYRQESTGIMMEKGADRRILGSAQEDFE